MDFQIQLVMLLMMAGASHGQSGFELVKKLSKCAGEDTKAAEVLQPTYVQCGGLTSTLFSPSPCIYHCVAMKLNLVQSDGFVNKKAVKALAKKLGNFSRKKMVINRSLKCVDGQNLLPPGKDCPIAKKAWACVLAATDDVCNGIKPPADNTLAQAEPLTDFYDTEDI